jgi:hypothetical protein
VSRRAARGWTGAHATRAIAATAWTPLPADATPEQREERAQPNCKHAASPRQRKVALRSGSARWCHRVVLAVAGWRGGC